MAAVGVSLGALEELEELDELEGLEELDWLDELEELELLLEELDSLLELGSDEETELGIVTPLDSEVRLDSCSLLEHEAIDSDAKVTVRSINDLFFIKIPP